MSEANFSGRVDVVGVNINAGEIIICPSQLVALDLK